MCELSVNFVSGHPDREKMRIEAFPPLCTLNDAAATSIGENKCSRGVGTNYLVKATKRISKVKSKTTCECPSSDQRTKRLCDKHNPKNATCNGSLLGRRNVNIYSCKSQGSRRSMGSLSLPQRKLTTRTRHYSFSGGDGELTVRPTREHCRVSFPCINGCVHCAFTKCFGPVKVFFSNYDTPRKPVVREICDGNGKKFITRDRRREFQGLVYDRETHSLYPPVPRGYHTDLLQVSKTRRVFY